CRTVDDCRLENDCCQCAAGPASDPVPMCARECLLSLCSSMQLPPNQMSCTAGRCVAGFTCEPPRAGCLAATKPICPTGQVAAVSANAGPGPGGPGASGCYTGGCVPAEQCTTVTSCAECGPSLACVVYQTQLGAEYHCVTPTPACGGDFTCGCLGPSVCTGTHRSCTNLAGQRGVSCSCPTC
ncbi:MAG TPA: hypothetical protein VIU64_04520, partial [Polyangia bacterium]